jgi:hypothetical protein
MTKATVDVNDLAFTPVGAHNSGLAISSAVSLTIPAGASKLMIQALTQNVRFTLDGTAATTSLGFQLKAGDPPVIIPLAPLTPVVKVIEETATASLQYQFGR